VNIAGTTAKKFFRKQSTKYEIRLQEWIQHAGLELESTSLRLLLLLRLLRVAIFAMLTSTTQVAIMTPERSEVVHGTEEVVEQHAAEVAAIGRVVVVVENCFVLNGDERNEEARGMRWG